VAEAEARGFIRRERGAKVELGWDALGTVDNAGDHDPSYYAAAKAEAR
jgi:hypothetical protein